MTLSKNEELEKEFNIFKKKHDEIYTIIAKNLPDLSVFDLGFFCIITLIKMGPLFSDINAKIFHSIMHQLIHLQIESNKKANE